MVNSRSTIFHFNCKLVDFDKGVNNAAGCGTHTNAGLTVVPSLPDHVVYEPARVDVLGSRVQLLANDLDSLPIAGNDEALAGHL